MKNKVEVWEKHPDIPGIEVSTLGRVRSAKGYCYKNNPGNSGYLLVQFYMNGKHVNKNVHRLVAETFIPNPNNLPEVNHKNGDRTNNNVSNLEWCSHSYNIQYRGVPVFAVNLSKPDNAVDLTKQKLREIGETKLTAGDEYSADFVIRYY